MRFSGWDRLPGCPDLCASTKPLSTARGHCHWELQQWGEAGNEAFIPGGMEEFPLQSHRDGFPPPLPPPLPPSHGQSLKPDRCEVGEFLFQSVRKTGWQEFGGTGR